MSKLFVQFTHPGSEHSLSKSEKAQGIKNWNYNDHRRKFLEAKGDYVDSQNELHKNSTLRFWGEWEPMSYVSPINYSNPCKGDYPNYVHKPFLRYKNGALDVEDRVEMKNSTKLRQNTDPNVFCGGDFYYCCCKQHKAEKRTQLSYLEPGSIILFGCTINPKDPDKCYFALDTVFVVRESSDYKIPYNKDLSGFVSPDYEDITGFDLWDGKSEFRCYKGASYKNKYDEMYSFSPCKVKEDQSTAFERVKIRLQDFQLLNRELFGTNEGLIVNNLNAQPKFTKLEDSELKKIWLFIREMVRKQGFCEGVRFEYSQEK